MTTVDLRRELPQLYRAAAAPALVDVPPLDYLMVDGSGDPNTAPESAEAVQALYSVAYTVRFALTRAPDPMDAPDHAPGGALVGARHVDVLGRGQVAVGLDDDDRPVPRT